MQNDVMPLDPTTRCAATALSPLVRYALVGLRRCWMSEHSRYSYRYHFDAASPHNESVSEADAFYTLNVLLGLSRVMEVGHRECYDIKAIYDRCCREAGNPKLKTYAYGMALWAGARLGIAPPAPMLDRVRAILKSGRALSGLTAQDIGMLACGITALTKVDDKSWRVPANVLVARLRDNYYHASTNMFYNQAKGPRRLYSSFASQVYSMLALYQYGEAFGADWAIDVANNAAAAMIARQGRRGEWAWFYYVPGGRIVDFYEIYSVHQHGMAPAFLHHAVEHGVPSARDALIKGFGWLFGENEMGVSMLRPVERMFYRSQVRESEMHSSGRRVARSVANAVFGRMDSPERHRGLVLRKECRSYELGWILWSFGARSDYRELTERLEFAV